MRVFMHKKCTSCYSSTHVGKYVQMRIIFEVLSLSFTLSTVR